MSDFISFAKERYATKKYDASKKISDEKIQNLKEALLLSPSSINSQPWKFAFISDEETKTKLSKVSYMNAEKVLECSHLVVFNIFDAIAPFVAQLEKTAHPGIVEYYKENVMPLGEDFNQQWFSKQLYLSLGFFLSACASYGIDATPMEGIIPEEYDKVLSIPNYKSVVAVAIGYRSEEDQNQPSKTPKSRLGIDEAIVSI